jgi:hypothetical protein
LFLALEMWGNTQLMIGLALALPSIMRLLADLRLECLESITGNQRMERCE